MTVERTFRCDGPDCEHHMAHCIETEPPYPGWIVAHETPTEGDPLIFCSWDCCMKYAAQIPPPETIRFEGANE